MDGQFKCHNLSKSAVIRHPPKSYLFRNNCNFDIFAPSERG